MRKHSRTPPSARAQRGMATLLFIVFITLALVAATGAAIKATQGAQKLQHAEHTTTQAEMTAWAGVAILSKAVAALPPTAELTPGANVAFAGAQPGVSAKFVSKQGSLLVFEVVGSSATAKSVLRTALRMPTDPSGGGGGDTTVPGGAVLHGPTVFDGSVNYSNGTSPNLYVLDGALTLNGSVTGLETVCATGDVSIGSDIKVKEVCTNGNATFNGSATVTSVKAIGNVTLSGGAASTIGDIWSNGAVSLSGGSASAGTINASGNVSVTGGAARATNVYSEGNIEWTSSASGTKLSANGTVNYRPSGTTSSTDIYARGNVQVTTANNVRTKGATTLVGYWGQGIMGRLDGQGLLGGASWGSGGGAVVQSGTVGSAVTPYPSTVRVTIQPGYSVTVDAVVVGKVPVFAQPKITVDAYALKSSANFVFTGVDSAGNPKVSVKSINGVTDGDYFIAGGASGRRNFLCKAVNGATCVVPLVKVCQGYSDQNNCFSFSNGSWTVEGTTMVPGVLFFEGNLTVSNGTWANTFLATGDLSTGGGMKVYSPNYLPASYTCLGQADSAHSLQAWTSYGFSATTYATQLCGGSPLTLKAAAVGNIALLAGGYANNVFVGGNVTLGSSNEIYGAVLAGQYLNTGGSTVVGGSIYSAAQGGSTAKTSNRQGGSTTVKTNGGSTAYTPDKVPCMTGCSASSETPTGNNVIWAASV